MKWRRRVTFYYPSLCGGAHVGWGYEYKVATSIFFLSRWWYQYSTMQYSGGICASPKSSLHFWGSCCNRRPSSCLVITFTSPIHSSALNHDVMREDAKNEWWLGGGEKLEVRYLERQLATILVQFSGKRHWPGEVPHSSTSREFKSYKHYFYTTHAIYTSHPALTQ